MYKQFLPYVDGNSFLHKLDPRTKIIALLILGVTIFKTPYIISLPILFILFFATVFIAHIPLKKLFLSLRPMLFFIGMVFLFHLITSSDRLPSEVFMAVELVRINILDAHDPGQIILVRPYLIQPFPGVSSSILPSIYNFVTGLGIAMKFALLVLFTSLMSATTKQSAIIQGIEWFLRPLPLKRTALTSHDLALMMFLTIHFIPMLISLSSQITDSASSRAFEIKKHPLQGIRIISIGLINSIISFSNDVSMAMLNRGYTGVGKTSLNELNFKVYDVVFFILFLIGLLTVIIFIGFLYLTMIFWMYYASGAF